MGRDFMHILCPFLKSMPSLGQVRVIFLCICLLLQAPFVTLNTHWNYVPRPLPKYSRYHPKQWNQYRPPIISQSHQQQVRRSSPPAFQTAQVPQWRFSPGSYPSNLRWQPRISRCNSCGCCPRTPNNPYPKQPNPNTNRPAPAYFNPCKFGEPILLNNLPRFCDWRNDAACPASHWCHVGQTAPTTCCCPTAGAEPCQLMVEGGQGASSLPRFFYDGVTKSCKPFIYRGTKGNANNFITKDKCEQRCPVTPNPCASGIPAMSTGGQTFMCSLKTAPNSCPPNYWCHIGGDEDTTACCPGSNAPCVQVVQAGEGRFALPRWYFDLVARKCQQFIYRGTMGNSNNFLTLEACQETCPHALDSFEICEVRPEGSPIRCGPTTRGGCPPGYWCHIGADVTTSICCAAAVAEPCIEPLDIGEGDAQLLRWYMDSSAGICGQCKQFSYGGRKGNQNNFLTKQDCEKCSTCQNPCPVGEPLKISGSAHVCNPSRPCPGSHWCHIGVDERTTVCCPSQFGDPCGMPKTEGSGTLKLERWFYNFSTQSCDPMTYRGLQGNQNNFISLQDCEALCPVFENPCQVGEPLMEGIVVKMCSPSSYCPSSHFCHVGADPETTVCCESDGLPCMLPRANGQGMYSLSRWYFDQTTRTCQQFQYKGMKGNSNNFLSESDCQATCPVFINPCATGAPAADPNGRPIICSNIAGCQPGFWCHIGADPDLTVCCPGAMDPCSGPIVIGNGNYALSRWGYDTTLRQCRTFMYTGIAGNANNFLSREDCVAACPEINPCIPPDQPYTEGGINVRCLPDNPASCPSDYFCHLGKDESSTVCCPRKGNPCEQPLVTGVGDGNTVSRWYYEAQYDECNKFKYYGTQGNENNFGSLQECEKTCPGFRHYCPHGKPLMIQGEPQMCSVETACPQDYVCHINTKISITLCCPAPISFCYMERLKGPCNEYEMRYGYNPQTNTCLEFEYGGCGGNMNNFRDLETCTEICCNDLSLMYNKA